MTREERKFRKLFEERYYDYYVITKERNDYEIGGMNSLREVAEQVFGIDCDKLEEKLFKKFKKSYWHHMICVLIYKCRK